MWQPWYHIYNFSVSRNFAEKNSEMYFAIESYLLTRAILQYCNIFVKNRIFGIFGYWIFEWVFIYSEGLLMSEHFFELGSN